MISRLKKLWKSEGQQDIVTPNNYNVKFQLTYEALHIGTLSLEKGVWSFYYSEDFKNQDEIKPLLEFPDVHKIYESEELLPFFALRIPGLGQPKVQKIIEKEEIEESNEAQLLERFGRTTIANPFILQAL